MKVCLHRVGRKPLFYMGGTVLCLAQIFACVVMSTQLHGGHMSQQAFTGMFVLICSFAASYGFSWGPLGNLVSPTARLGNAALHAGAKCMGLALHSTSTVGAPLPAKIAVIALRACRCHLRCIP